jgi:hypothetical protein
MIGTTIETSIRIRSRWGKDGVVRTEKDGFVVRSRGARSGVDLIQRSRLPIRENGNGRAGRARYDGGHGTVPAPMRDFRV